MYIRLIEALGKYKSNIALKSLRSLQSDFIEILDSRFSDVILEPTHLTDVIKATVKALGTIGGESAIGPLLEAAECPYVADLAINKIKAIVEHNIKDISNKVLEMLAQTGQKKQYVTEYDKPDYSEAPAGYRLTGEEKTINCEDIKDQASRELERR